MCGICLDAQIAHYLPVVPYMCMVFLAHSAVFGNVTTWLSIRKSREGQRSGSKQVSSTLGPGLHEQQSSDGQQDAEPFSGGVRRQTAASNGTQAAYPLKYFGVFIALLVPSTIITGGSLLLPCLPVSLFWLRSLLAKRQYQSGLLRHESSAVLWLLVVMVPLAYWYPFPPLEAYYQEFVALK